MGYRNAVCRMLGALIGTGLVAVAGWCGEAPAPAVTDLRVVAMEIEEPRGERPHANEGLKLTFAGTTPAGVVDVKSGTLVRAATDNGQDLLIRTPTPLTSLRHTAPDTVQFQVTLDYPVRTTKALVRLEGALTCRMAGDLERRDLGRHPLQAKREDAGDEDDAQGPRFRLHRMDEDRFEIWLPKLEIREEFFLGMRFSDADGRQVVFRQNGRDVSHGVLRRLEYRLREDGELPESLGVELLVLADAGERTVAIRLESLPFPDAVLAPTDGAEDPDAGLEAVAFERLRPRFVQYRLRPPLSARGHRDERLPPAWECEVVLSGRLPVRDQLPERFDDLRITSAVTDRGRELVPLERRVDRIGQGGRRSVRLFVPLPLPAPDARRIERIEAYLPYSIRSAAEEHDLGEAAVEPALGNEREHWWRADLYRHADAAYRAYRWPDRPKHLLLVLPHGRTDANLRSIREVTVRDPATGRPWPSRTRSTRTENEVVTMEFESEADVPDRVHLILRTDEGMRVGRIAFAVEDVELPPMPEPVAASARDDGDAADGAGGEKGGAPAAGPVDDDAAPVVRRDALTDCVPTEVQFRRYSAYRPGRDDSYAIRFKATLPEPVLRVKEGDVTEARTLDGVSLLDSLSGRAGQVRLRRWSREKPEVEFEATLALPAQGTGGLERLAGTVRYLTGEGVRELEFGLLEARPLPERDASRHVREVAREEEDTPAFYFRRDEHGYVYVRENGYLLKEIRLLDADGAPVALKKGVRKRFWSNKQVQAECTGRAALPDAVQLVVVLPTNLQIVEVPFAVEKLDLLAELLPEKPLDRRPPPRPQPHQPPNREPAGPPPPPEKEPNVQRPEEPEIF